MKRTPLIITLLICITTIFGIWYYQSIRKVKISPWDFVSDNAAFVLELRNLQSSIDTLKEILPLERIVSSTGFLNKISKIRAFNDRKILLSAHPIKRDDFDFIVYADVGKKSQVLILKELEELFTQPYSWSKRSYNGQDIFEVFLKSKLFFSITAMEGILIGSNSSFLLEGTIRIHTSESTAIFKNSNVGLFKLPSLKSDEGDIYINLKNFSNYLQIFTMPTGLGFSSLQLGTSSIADLKFNQNQILFNGFLTEGDSSLLSLFRNQRPQLFDLESLISNKTAVLVHYGFSDTQNWFEQEQSQLDKTSQLIIDSLAVELRNLSIDIQSIRKSIGNQFANAFTSEPNAEIVSIFNLSESSGSAAIFDELALKLSDRKRDSLYLEPYAGYEIKLIDQKNFLYQLLYPLAYQAGQSFFVRIGQSMLFAENVELIKQFIDDIDSENTWGRSVDWNKYLSSSQRESNINLFFNGKLTQFLLRTKLNSTWKPFFDTTSFMGIDKGSIQISRLDENYYLNSSFQFFENVHRSNQSLTKTAYDFGTRVTLAPTIVRSHVSKEIKLLVQDSLNELYFLSNDLKVQWKKNISAPVVDIIELIDYYKNGKLQYLIATHTDVNIIDRLGRDVEDFPRKLANINFMYSKLIDYDRSKNYRFLLVDRKGALYLTDKRGSPLEGWNPRMLTGDLIEPARHYRILGRDYFVAVQNNGDVQVLNRRGKNVKGFPQSLSIRPAGNYFIDIGTLSTTSVTIVSHDGLLLQQGLDGQLKKREVLLKRTESSQFSLIKSRDEKSFIIVRIDPDKVGVLSGDGTLAFEFENPGSTTWRIGFIENSLKEKSFCFYDELQNFSYFYDDAGNLLFNQPVESTLMPSLFYDEKNKNLSIYNVNGSEVSLIEIKN